MTERLKVRWVVAASSCPWDDVVDVSGRLSAFYTERVLSQVPGSILPPPWPIASVCRCASLLVVALVHESLVLRAVSASSELGTSRVLACGE